MHTETARVRLDEEGVVHVEIQPFCEQSPPHARANLELAISRCAGARRPILVDVRGGQPLGKESRQVYSQGIVSQSFLGLAMVTNTDHLSRLMINVYFEVARLSIPTRMFNEPAPARTWLLGWIP